MGGALPMPSQTMGNATEVMPVIHICAPVGQQLVRQSRLTSSQGRQRRVPSVWSAPGQAQ
jgi:hypothetical protein